MSTQEGRDSSLSTLKEGREKGHNAGHLLRDVTYKWLSTNVKSLQPKIVELEYLVLNDDIDIIFITEIWWKEDTVMPEYKLYTNDREGELKVVLLGMT